jgi:Kef-type K+ transport system membrane component KefB
MTFLIKAWEWLHAHALSTPSLARFALGMVIIVGIPPLCRRIRLPAVVGLLLSGVVHWDLMFLGFSENTRPSRISSLN